MPWQCSAISHAFPVHEKQLLKPLVGGTSFLPAHVTEDTRGFLGSYPSTHPQAGHRLG